MDRKEGITFIKYNMRVRTHKKHLSRSGVKDMHTTSLQTGIQTMTKMVMNYYTLIVMERTIDKY